MSPNFLNGFGEGVWYATSRMVPSQVGDLRRVVSMTTLAAGHTQIPPFDAQMLSECADEIERLAQELRALCSSQEAKAA